MTNRDRRALLIGAAIIVPWVAGFRGVPAAVRALSDMEERTVVKAALLESSRRELRSLPALRDSVAWMEGITARLPEFLLVSGTREEARLEMMGRLNMALEEVPASVEFQVDESESVRRGPLGRARVWVSMETDVRGLREAISAIGLDRGFSLHSISVEAIDPEAPAEVGEILAVRLETEGWFMAADTVGREVGS